MIDGLHPAQPEAPLEAMAAALIAGSKAMAAFAPGTGVLVVDPASGGVAVGAIPHPALMRAFAQALCRHALDLPRPADCSGCAASWDALKMAAACLDGGAHSC